MAAGIMFSKCSCVRVCTDFERKYLWNGLSYQQAANSVINYNLSHIEQKNRELWSTNNGS